MLAIGRLNLSSIHRSLSCTAAAFKGHSKWQNIKATKGKNDMIRSQKTNLLLRRVKTAVQHGGFDPKLNRKLADLQFEFKSAGLPVDTLNNYLTKLKNKPDLTFYFDLIGPSGSFVIIETEGDNKNRIQAAVYRVIKKIGGFRFATDSLRNRFEEKAVVKIAAKQADGKELNLEQAEELAIELECEEVSDVTEEDGLKFEFTADGKDLSKLENALTSQGYTVESAESQLVPIYPITLSPDEVAVVDKLYEQLQDVEEVRNIYDNLGDTAESQTASA